jgi:hypothetical protein
VAVRVDDDFEVVEVDHHDRHVPAARQLLVQPLMAGAVIEQPGQPVALDLLAQRLALARRVVGERRHRREALDEPPQRPLERIRREDPRSVNWAPTLTYTARSAGVAQLARATAL